MSSRSGYAVCIRLMVAGNELMSSGVRALVAQAALGVPAVRVALVVSEDPVEQVALVESEDPVEPAGQESPAAQVALVVSEDPAELVALEGPAELVVLESPAELVVLESPAEPVVPERELVQVEAVPAREHPRARPAVE